MLGPDDAAHRAHGIDERDGARERAARQELAGQRPEWTARAVVTTAATASAAIAQAGEASNRRR